MVNEILAEPGLRHARKTLGVVRRGGTPQDLSKFIQAEYDRWAPMHHRAGPRQVDVTASRRVHDCSASRPLYRPDELARLFAPRSIAVVGVSTNPASFGSITLRQHRRPRPLRRAGVPGERASYERIGDAPCYPSIAALPETPDCVFIAVPREAVEGSRPGMRGARRGRRGAVLVGLCRDGAGRARRRRSSGCWHIGARRGHAHARAELRRLHELRAGRDRHVRHRVVQGRAAAAARSGS